MSLVAKYEQKDFVELSCCQCLEHVFCSHRVYSDLIIGTGAMTFRLVKRSSDFVSLCANQNYLSRVYTDHLVLSHTLNNPCVLLYAYFHYQVTVAATLARKTSTTVTKNVSATGRPCLQWSTFPTYAAFSYSFYLHGADNFCRDPYPQRGRLWCIIGPTVEDWEYCNVSNCEQGNTLIQACWNAYHFSEKRLFEINIIRWTLWKQTDQLNFAAF